MDNATKILVLGGVVALVASMVLGFFFAQARQGGAQAPRYLVMAHVSGMMGGTLLLALTVAVRAATLSSGLKTLCAALLAGGMLTLITRDVLNWRAGVADEFKASPGLPTRLAIGGSVAMSIGLAIVAVGVLSAVFA